VLDPVAFSCIFGERLLVSIEKQIQIIMRKQGIFLKVEKQTYT
jgi:hypothetical protein